MKSNTPKEIKYCECGCGQIVNNRFACGHHRRGVPSWNASSEIKVSQLCQCGCGQLTNPGKKYIKQHHCIGKPAHNKGSKMSEDQKQKLSEVFKEGYASGKRVPWNKGMAGDPNYFLTGVKRSSESIRKMVETKLKNGKKLSEETKKLIGSYHKGKVISDEQKAFLSKLHKGRKNSEEHNKKIGDSHRGSKRSVEARKRMSEAQKRINSTGIRQDLKINKKRSITMLDKFKNDETYLDNWIASCKLKPNKLELLFNDLLQEMFPNEWKYVGDFQFFLGGKNPDFMNVNGKKKLIELFGDYWHQGEDPKDRINHFKQYGFDTLVLWESEIKNNLEEVKHKLTSYAS